MQEYLDDVSSGKNYKFTDSEMQANASVLESKTGRIIGLMSAKIIVRIILMRLI